MDLPGCGLAFVATPAMLSLIGDSVPRAANAGVDLRVLCLCDLAVLPRRAHLRDRSSHHRFEDRPGYHLKEGGRTEISHRDWLRSSLIVAQVALGLVLTAGAGLLITSFMNLLHTEEGFNPDHLLTFFFELPDSQYKQKRPRVLSRLLREGARAPGRAIGGRRHGPAHDQ